MKIRIPQGLVEAIGVEPLNRLTGDQVSEDPFSYADYVQVDLDLMNRPAIEKLRAAIEAHRAVRGAVILMKDIDTFFSALGKPGSVRPRKLPHFEQLLIDYLLTVPGHRLFSMEGSPGLWLCCGVSDVKYHPEERSRDHYQPAYVQLDFFYDKLGSRHESSVEWYVDDIQGKTVEESLAAHGFYAETPERRETYLAEVARYKEIIPQIGKQYLASGIARDEISRDRWSWRSTDKIVYVDGERPNKVVIDLFREEGEDESRGSSRVDVGLWFWQRQAQKKALHIDLGEGAKLEEQIKIENERAERERERQKERRRKRDRGEHIYERDKEEIELDDLVEEETPVVIEVPIHPYVVIFDLNRHARLSIHVSNLVEYVYDQHLADKLVLPVDIKALVKMLVERKSTAFRDLVSGKSGGAIVLLTGPPGTGKTLTAEVFAEAEQKPLYSVQASQLGTDPDELEKNLMRILARSARWNAVCLLDESDVYVHERGDNLAQNAIVGVFLRTLEYHASVLFLVTNRPDLIDDAIASRCVARIDYTYPSVDDQRKIWRVLADNSSTEISDEVIDEFAQAHPKVSGRDVKNLLKLSSMISSVGKEPISVAGIEYALRFKPTVSIGDTTRYRSEETGHRMLPPITPVPELEDGTSLSLEDVANVQAERWDAYVRSTRNPKPSEASRVLLGRSVGPDERQIYRAVRGKLQRAMARASKVWADE